MHDDVPLEIAKKLLRLPSVTPNDAGCQQYITNLISQQGFVTEQLRFGDVDNLWATRGSGSPLVVFAGHTDVVPVGDENAWGYPPFSATVTDNKLYGRGAADMKGGIAAFLAAISDIKQNSGTLALLLTSDEEGPAIDGTVKVIDVLQQRGIRADAVILGEPSSQAMLGDCVRIGRRGSLSANIRLLGKGGHVAYPQHVRNPIHLATDAIYQLAHRQWDAGTSEFPPTSLQFTKLHCDSAASNVVPEEMHIKCNLRFNPITQVANIKQVFSDALTATGLKFEIEWNLSAQPFISKGGTLREKTREVISEHCGIQPDFSTGGGTSDGRFLIAISDQIIELGLVNSTIHQCNEHIEIADLSKLSDIYTDLFNQLLIRA